MPANFIAPYVEAIKKDVGLLVGVQLAPEHDFTRNDELVALGVDHLSLCVELLDPEWFARICPGKAHVHGQALYFNAMKYCVSLMSHGDFAIGNDADQLALLPCVTTGISPS